MMHPLPPYARRIEYLESTGTQWIDTELGYFPEFEIGAVVPDAVGNNTLGIDQSWKLGRHSAAEPVWGASLNNRSYATSVSCGTYADMSYHGTTFKCNSDTITVPANQYVSGTMVLFSTGVALPSAYPLKLYYCRLFDQNGNLVRSFVPCRILDVGYLWDEVEGKFYGNSGTGDFVLGPDVREGVVPTRLNPFGVGRRQEEIRRVEYLESTGTQYVDTGVPFGEMTVSARVNFINASATKMILACGGPGDNRGFVISTGLSGTQKWLLGIGAAYYDGAVAAGTWYDVEAVIRSSGSSLSVGEQPVMSTSAYSNFNGVPLYVFARNNNGTADLLNPAARVASLKIWDSQGVLVRDFVPVRVGTAGALYDRANPTGGPSGNGLYGSATSTPLVAGPDRNGGAA